jgi:hypothetical protein
MGTDFSLDFVIEKSDKKMPITSFSILAIYTVYNMFFCNPNQTDVMDTTYSFWPLEWFESIHNPEFAMCSHLRNHSALPAATAGLCSFHHSTKHAPSLPTSPIQLSCGQDAVPGRFYNLRLCGPTTLWENFWWALLSKLSPINLHDCTIVPHLGNKAAPQILVAEIDHWRKGIGSTPPPPRG